MFVKIIAQVGLRGLWGYGGCRGSARGLQVSTHGCQEIMKNLFTETSYSSGLLLRSEFSTLAPRARHWKADVKVL